MISLFKKVLFCFILNSALFLLLIIGIQNSTNRSKVKLITGDTITLPIGFIVGMSFISGSISGSLLTLNYGNRKEKIKEQ
tara:strand:- start:622 stop:861 length:240 start_codon:yes stop_codon:yes gene_type:complete